MLRLLALVVVLTGVDAMASCVAVNRCQCDSHPTWVALVSIAADGGPTIERVFTAGTEGPTAEERARFAGPPGTRFLIHPSFSEKFGTPGEVAIAPDGLVHCESAVFEPNVWGGALVDGTCVTMLKNAGVVQPPCRDVVGCGRCSAAPALPFAARMLLMLRRHRRVR